MHIHVHDPKTIKHKWQNLISEFFGTLLLTFFIIVLIALYINKGPLLSIITLHRWVKVASLGGLMLFIYVVVLIGALIILFERWSANLNPSIALYLYLAKLCSKRYTIEKIVAEFLGGICAGGLAFLLAYYTDYSNLASNTMGGFNSEVIASFGTPGSAGQIVSANFTSLIIEMLAAMGICFYLFSRQIKADYRFVSISLYFGLAIPAVIDTGVIGFNPARSFGPVLFHDFYLIGNHQLTAANSELLLYPMYIIGPVIGVWGFYYIDKKFGAKLEKWFNKITFTSFSKKSVNKTANKKSETPPSTT